MPIVTAPLRPVTCWPDFDRLTRAYSAETMGKWVLDPQNEMRRYGKYGAYVGRYQSSETSGWLNIPTARLGWSLMWTKGLQGQPDPQPNNQRWTRPTKPRRKKFTCQHSNGATVPLLLALTGPGFDPHELPKSHISQLALEACDTGSCWIPTAPTHKSSDGWNGHGSWWGSWTWITVASQTRSNRIHGKMSGSLPIEISTKPGYPQPQNPKILFNLARMTL